jgi:hypothetical protein
VVLLHIASPTLSQALEATTDSVEGVANRDVDVLVRVIISAMLPHYHFAVGDGDVNADAIRIPFVLVVVRRFDHDTAARDVAAQLLEFLDLGAHLGVNRLGARKTTARDLNWQFHPL